MNFIVLFCMVVMTACYAAPNNNQMRQKRNTPTASDVTYSVEDIKEASDYDNLCYTCSMLLVGVDGNLEKYETYTTGYIESAIKVTKNYSGPKYQYLVGAGLFKIHSGEKLEEVDFKLFGAEASVHNSATGAGTYSIILQY